MNDGSNSVRDDRTSTPAVSLRAHFDWTATSPSSAVVRAVAIATDARPTALEALYESVDPDALDEYVLAGSTAAATDYREISFTYGGVDVTVASHGEVLVESTPASE